MKVELYTSPDTRPWKVTGPGVCRRVRSFDAGIMAVEVAFEEGAIGAAHHHPHSQVTYCLSGVFRFETGQGDVMLHPGDTLVFPSNESHGCVALEAGVLLDIFAPVREDFLQADGLG